MKHTSRLVIIAGTISFERVDKILGDKLEDTSEQVHQQVEILYKFLEKAGVYVENMDVRADQICNYLTVLTQQQTAQVLLDIRTKLNLTGNFDAIRKPLVSCVVMQNY